MKKTKVNLIKLGDALKVIGALETATEEQLNEAILVVSDYSKKLNVMFNNAFKEKEARINKARASVTLFEDEELDNGKTTLSLKEEVIVNYLVDRDAALKISGASSVKVDDIVDMRATVNKRKLIKMAKAGTLDPKYNGCVTQNETHQMKFDFDFKD